MGKHWQMSTKFPVFQLPEFNCKRCCFNGDPQRAGNTHGNGVTWLSNMMLRATFEVKRSDKNADIVGEKQA